MNVWRWWWKKIAKLPDEPSKPRNFSPCRLQYFTTEKKLPNYSSFMAVERFVVYKYNHPLVLSMQWVGSAHEIKFITLQLKPTELDHVWFWKSGQQCTKYIYITHTNNLLWVLCECCAPWALSVYCAVHQLCVMLYCTRYEWPATFDYWCKII